MATATEAPVTNPSMADLRSMISDLGSSKPAVREETPAGETETAEPEQSEQHTEAATAPASEKQPEEVEEELPENVRKKIEREAKKQAFFQSQIDKAVNARKAKEAEAAKVTGTSGSEPAPKTEPAKDAEPIEPDLATFPGGLPEFQAAMAQWRKDYREWVNGQTRETVTKELTERQIKEAMEREYETAAEKHGEEFNGLMASLRDETPPEFQLAVSKLENWDGVAVHLAKNEKEREVMLNTLKTRGPEALLIQLGKLEDRLKPEAKPETEEQPLPKPLKPVGGGARGASPAFDFAKASVSEVRRYVQKTQAR